MNIQFYKYQGTGNDFVIIDHRKPFIDHENDKLIAKLCDRKFGVGADGLILLENKQGYDFEMVYFNADGRQSSMCGNGGRCIVAFAKFLGIIKEQASFLAIDGPHQATCKEDGRVELLMNDVAEIEDNNDHYVLDTGSPHYVTFLENQQSLDVYEKGKAIRYNNRFKENGINVNFVSLQGEGILVSTYERGVENETLSCGTGVTAAAIAHAIKTGVQSPTEIPIYSKGGQLSVKLSPGKPGFSNIWLCGPATLVFEGQVNI